MILSQTKIFNIFPGSLQTSLLIKIMSLIVTDTITATFHTETPG